MVHTTWYSDEKKLMRYFGRRQRTTEKLMVYVYPAILDCKCVFVSFELFANAEMLFMCTQCGKNDGHFKERIKETSSNDKKCMDYEWYRKAVSLACMKLKRAANIDCICGLNVLYLVLSKSCFQDQSTTTKKPHRNIPVCSFYKMTRQE